MAIVVVQAKAITVTGGPATFPGSFTSLPAAGNSVIVFGGCNADQGVSTFADNQSNSYTQIALEVDSFNSNSCFAWAYWSPSIGTPSGTFTTTLTPTTPGNGGNAGFVMLEVSGLNPTIDKTGVAQDSSGNNTSLTVTGSAANANANDLAIYAIVLRASGNNPTFFSAGATSGWTNTLVDNSNSNGVNACAGYKILSATETSQAVSQTWTTASFCAGVLATIQANPGPPPFGGGVCVGI